MNKKVVLSVLSTTLVASVAASAFAAPKDGIYIGGNIKKYYSTDVLFEMTPQAKATYASELNAMASDFNNVVFVDYKGKGASIEELFTKGSKVALGEPLKKEDFADLYKVVNKDGSSTATEDARAKVDPTPTGDLKVESVSAINASQVKIQFTQAVDKDTATNVANYTIAGATKKSATLTDSKTVTLTLDPASTVALNQTTVTFGVQNVKSADEKVTIPAFSGKVSFLDLTLPTVTSAKQVGPGLVQVFFSEPVEATSGFLLDGGKYSVTISKKDPATNSIILATGSLALGEHTITVNPDGDKNVVDGAGLKVSTSDVKFTVSQDTTAPVLTSAVANSQKEVILTFDEAITSLDPSAVYHTANIKEYQATEASAVPGSNDKQWKVTFTNPLPTGTVAINVAKEAIQDNFGNKNSKVLSATVTISADTVKPTVTELKVVDTSQVTLTFSEDVTGANVKSNYKVTDKDGKVVTGFTVTYLNKKATLMFNPALKEGASYTVELTGVKDTAVVPNEIDKYTSTFTVGDTTPPVVQSGLYDKPNHKITIFFSEAINGTDLLDKSKYTLVAGATQVALPSDATVAVGPNNTSVNITIPAVVKDRNGNDITNAIDKVIVGQVSDLAGNKTAKVYSEISVATTAGDITVVADSALTLDTKTVQFAVKKPLKSIKATDFRVDGKAVEFADFENKSLTDGTYGSVITLKVAKDKAFATDAKPPVTVVAQDTLSVYGDKFPLTFTVTPNDGVAPVLADVNGDNKVDGKDLKFKLNADNKVEKITVTFSEALKSGTVSIDDFQVDGHSIGNVALDNENVVVIELSKAGNNDELYTVRFVGAVSDKNGNVFEGKGVALENASVVVPVDKTTLDTAITEAGKLVEADYSTGWAEFQAALNAAKAVQSNKDATKADVEKAVADLNTATKALVKKPVAVDKTALDNAITEADKLVEADYSAGWAEFQTALNAAKTVQSNKDATKADVEKAVADLGVATKALVKN
ncbi:Ig-like domain-containing protein [Brevibacillus brevis]|uniref:Ig-like domain-containing protein n=1 Tax=Brevibacillus brevis TaxID=1393 RepID=UPI00115B7533|nr:Ig-like domain-containing protein [Lysinibacillus sp. SDF0063]TQR32592.1 hypothetical protein C7Y45_21125 [Lysinibacillus sp. SDF0063]